MNRIRRSTVLAVAGAACLATALPARAQETPPPKAWSDTAEFSFVSTAGNSETTTLGFKNTLGRKWDSMSFELKAGGVRAETTAISRTAVGTGPSNFSVIEDKTTTLSAENYYLNGRFDRKVSEHVFWFGG